MFKFIQSTPTAGDCTCGYYIVLDKEYTVGEFMDTVLKEKIREWGSIGIYDGKSIFGKPSCQYDRGELITDNLPDEYLTTPIKEVVASGGWSRMDYSIKI